MHVLTPVMLTAYLHVACAGLGHVSASKEPCPIVVHVDNGEFAIHVTNVEDARGGRMIIYAADGACRKGSCEQWGDVKLCCL